jgi:general secretion pathway protein C
MSSRQQQLLANGMTFLLVVAVGLQMAWWSWHFVVPEDRATGAIPSIGAPSRDIGEARLLFGGDGSSPPAGATAVASDIHLKGVFAVDGKILSAAVVNLGGRDQAVKQNQVLSNGAKLIEVHPDYIIVSRNGLDERIDLDIYRGGNPGTTVASAANAASAASSRSAGSGFRLNVTSPAKNNFSLSRLELNNVLQDPRQMEFLGRIGTAPAGGVRIEDAPANTLSSKLGLQAGDIITNINGQPVSSPGDLARFYQQFATLSQVRVEVKRGGSPLMLTYVIQN